MWQLRLVEPRLVYVQHKWGFQCNIIYLTAFSFIAIRKMTLLHTIGSYIYLIKCLVIVLKKRYPQSYPEIKYNDLMNPGAKVGADFKSLETKVQGLGCRFTLRKKCPLLFLDLLWYLKVPGLKISPRKPTKSIKVSA